MGVKILDGRIKGPKKQGTFGRAKKPFVGKNRNRKGSLKNSFSTSAVKREPLNSNKAVRFPTAKYKQRQDDIRALGACQVCERFYTLDAPHHVMQGVGTKDDRFMINICIDCHGLIHTIGYSAVKKNREECREIAWSNHILLEEEL